MPKLTKKDDCEKEINEIFSKVLDEESPLEFVSFQKGALEYGTYRSLEMRDCEFNGTYFDHLDLPNGYLLDVYFKDCDLSNAKFDHTLFRRVHFDSCKLTGADFSETLLDQVLFENCQMNYTNFSASKIKALKFQECDMPYISFMENDLKKAEFEKCNLTKAEFLHSSLYQKDLSDCIIDGIILAIEDLKGAIVSTEQALNLALLLGIQIKDE